MWLRGCVLQLIRACKCRGGACVALSTEHNTAIAGAKTGAASDVILAPLRLQRRAPAWPAFREDARWRCSVDRVLRRAAVHPACGRWRGRVADSAFHGAVGARRHIEAARQIVLRTWRRESARLYLNTRRVRAERLRGCIDVVRGAAEARSIANEPGGASGGAGRPGGYARAV